MGTSISPNRKLLNVEELSNFIGTPVGTLYQWVSQKKIPYVKLGRSTKFDIERIEVWIKANSVEEKNF